MGLYGEYIVPFCVELGCRTKAIVPLRERATRGLHGRVLEIGFGSGLNVPYYPSEVHEVLAVDPSRTSRRIGRARIASARCAITPVGLDAERIDVGDATADAALSTFTLCTIPDAVRALREVRRILRPGARLHFAEHGRAPDLSVARWQDRLDGLQSALCGGCHLTRDIPALLREAGFVLETLDRAYMPDVPRTHGFMYQGIARAASA